MTIGFAADYLEEFGLTVKDFDHFIFHQANTRMLDEISHKLSIPPSKMRKNLELIGNTAAASVPICMAQMNERGNLQEGERLFLCSFGAGYTIGIADIIWTPSKA